MDVRTVDPRDMQWESESAVYRVHFWKQRASPPCTPHPHTALESEEHEVRGARDVRQVLNWADAAAGPARTYTLYLVVDRGEELGMVRLAGDPN